MATKFIGSYPGFAESKNFQKGTKFSVNRPVTASRLPVKNRVQSYKSIVTGG